MKNTLFSLLLVCIVTAFTNCPASAYASNMQLQETHNKTIEKSQNDIYIIRSITSLKRGDVGLITIKGKPGERYTIESSFSVNGRTIPVRQWRNADSNGMASFSWVVGEDTDIGTYKATIYGDGSSISLTHTVIS